MAPAEYVATFAAEVDTGSISQLQSLMSEISGIAQDLAGALESVSAALSSIPGAASAAAGPLSSLSSPFSATASSAQSAADAVNALVSAYSGLSAATPTGALEINLSGTTDSYENGQQSSAVVDLLSGISSQLGRFFVPTGNEGSGGGSGTTAGGDLGFALNLNTDALQEQLDGFLDSLTEQKAELSLTLLTDDADSALDEFTGALADTDASLALSLDTSDAQSALDALLSSAESSAPVADLSLDTSAADSALQALLQKASTQISLSADASGIVSAASAALSEVESLFSKEFTISASVSISDGGGDSGGGKNPSTGSGTGGRTGDSGGSSPLAMLLMSTGGRFTRPTQVEVAEEGSTEYIIPVDKESLAVPLLRQLLTELSAPARDAVLGSQIPGALNALSDFSPDSGGAAGPLVSTMVQAPVNITVTASGTDAAALGQSVYDAAERYLVRALENVV